jgi:hypothetical protein
LWVIDDYDAWYPLDHWIRHEVFPLLPAQARVLFVGTPLVTRMWIGDQHWMRIVDTVELPLLDPQTAYDVVTQWGVTDSHTAGTLVKMANGHPVLLRRLAQSLQTLQDTTSLAVAKVEYDVSSFFIEHALHLGSRRLRWRAGWGEPAVDVLVGAASLVKWCDKAVMETMVGRELTQKFWPEYVALPFVHSEPGGITHLVDAMAREVESDLEELRPWTAQRWRLNGLHGLRHPLNEAKGSQRATLWEQWCWISREWRFGGSLHPTPERQEPWQVAVSRSQDSVRVSATMGDGVELGRLMATIDRTGEMTITEVEVRDPLVLPTLIRYWAGEFRGVRAVTWPGSRQDLPQSALAALTPLGFSAVPEGWRLDLSDGYLAWLDQLMRPLGWSNQVNPSQTAQWVQDALQIIHDVDSLSHNPLAWHLRRDTSPLTGGQLKAWLLDALASAELGDWPSGRVLLTLYYIDRAGSHESLAERLNVSRATYFRCHRRAIERLAAALIPFVQE